MDLNRKWRPLPISLNFWIKLVLSLYLRPIVFPCGGPCISINELGVDFKVQLLMNILLTVEIKVDVTNRDEFPMDGRDPLIVIADNTQIVNKGLRSVNDQPGMQKSMNGQSGFVNGCNQYSNMKGKIIGIHVRSRDND